MNKTTQTILAEIETILDCIDRENAKFSDPDLKDPDSVRASVNRLRGVQYGLQRAFEIAVDTSLAS